MARKQKVMLAAVLMGVAGRMCSVAIAADAPQTKGRVEAVTVYRGQAMVMRGVEVPAAAGSGLVELVVTELPGTIEPASLFAEGINGAKVQSVRYRARPVVADVNENVRALDAQIAETQGKLAVNARQAALIEEQKKYVESLQGFVAPTAATEFKSGVLNAKTVQEISTFIMGERAKFAERELALTSEKKALEQQLAFAHAERQKVTAGSSRTLHEAVITLNKEGGGGRVNLYYIVNNATWSPSYVARRDSRTQQAGDKTVQLEYFADITQLSGEDWSDASLTLSTATPSLSSEGPKLLPMTLTLANPAADAEVARTRELLSKSYDDAKKEIRDKQASLNEAMNRVNARADNAPGQSRPQSEARAEGQLVVGAGGGGMGQWRADAMEFKGKLEKDINLAAADDQLLDLVANRRIIKRDEGRKPARSEGLSVVYSLPGKISVPSRDDRQLVQIMAAKLPANFVKVASPALTSYVYDEASVTNASATVLLAGPLTTYAEGAFVGRGDMPTITAGEHFTVGFGIDSSLRAYRDLVERSETTQGGNRVIDVSYRLRLENFATTPAQVRLQDRLPLSPSKDLTITQGPIAGLSDDPEYVKTKGKTGVLRWDVSVPASTFGTSEFGVEYSFKIEHDKQMILSGGVN
jgi:hypothetical protein